MGHLTIRTDDDPCLRKKSVPVKEIGASERLLLESMLETMYELPSRNDIQECMITEDVVTKRQQPSLLYKQAS